jgi:hypothetical protein
LIDPLPNFTMEVRPIATVTIMSPTPACVPAFRLPGSGHWSGLE